MTEMIVGSFANPEPWVQHVFTNTFGFSWDWEDGRTERRLTPEAMLSYSTMWYGVSKITGHIGQLPVQVFRRLERGAERDRAHSVATLLRRPNPLQTSIVFREQIACHSLIEGNGRAAIVRKGNRIVELLPMLPEYTVTIVFEGEKIHACKPPKHDRLRLYFSNPAEPNTEAPWLFFDDAEVMHIPGLSLNGITGIALRHIASRNVGASIDAEKRLAKQMQAGFSGNLLLEAPPNMFRDQKDAEEFLDSFEKRHNGPDKAGKTGLLLEGMKAQVMAITNKDAEMTENRRFQRQDAALYLGLESILGDDQSVSYNSLEQKNLAYLMNCLNKWLKRWEEEMEYKLLPKRQFDNDTHFIRFNTAALLKSDFQSTVAALNTLVTGTILSRNEAREILDRNPVDGGDEYSNPAITPGTQPTDPPPEPAARLAINSRLAFFIEGEQKKVIDAAKQATEKGRNFVEWLETFYTARWPLKMADVLDELDLPRDEAQSYCDESKRRLLEVCDSATTENLAEKVKSVVSTWKNRANSIGVPEHV